MQVRQKRTKAYTLYPIPLTPNPNLRCVSCADDADETSAHPTTDDAPCQRSDSVQGGGGGAVETVEKSAGERTFGESDVAGGDGFSESVFVRRASAEASAGGVETEGGRVVRVPDEVELEYDGDVVRVLLRLLLKGEQRIITALMVASALLELLHPEGSSTGNWAQTYLGERERKVGADGSEGARPVGGGRLLKDEDGALLRQAALQASGFLMEMLKDESGGGQGRRRQQQAEAGAACFCVWQRSSWVPTRACGCVSGSGPRA